MLQQSSSTRTTSVEKRWCCFVAGWCFLGELLRSFSFWQVAVAIFFFVLANFQSPSAVLCSLFALLTGLSILFWTTFAAYSTVSPLFSLVLACSIYCIMTQPISLKLSFMILIIALPWRHFLPSSIITSPWFWNPWWFLSCHKWVRIHCLCCFLHPHKASCRRWCSWWASLSRWHRKGVRRRASAKLPNVVVSFQQDAVTYSESLEVGRCWRKCFDCKRCVCMCEVSHKPQRVWPDRYVLFRTPRVRLHPFRINAISPCECDDFDRVQGVDAWVSCWLLRFWSKQEVIDFRISLARVRCGATWWTSRGLSASLSNFLWFHTCVCVLACTYGILCFFDFCGKPSNSHALRKWWFKDRV